MKKSYSSESGKLDRKTVERNRRMHMKGLCFKLASLVPKHYKYSKEMLSQQDRLDYAALYIKELRDRLQTLKRKKELMMCDKEESNTGSNGSSSSVFMLLVLELRDMGSTLEVTLITGLNRNFMFPQLIGILEEEGAIVANATFSIVGDKIYHTIHSQDTCSRLEIESSRLSERLKDLVHFSQAPDSQTTHSETKLDKVFDRFYH